jgi:chemotaxis protein MotB
MGPFKILIVGLLGLCTVGCASTDWESRFRDEERQSNELAADLEASRNDVATLQAQNKVLEDQLDRERADGQRLRGELAELERARSEALAATPEPEPEVDISKLKRDMDFGDVKLDESGNVVITLESGITFSPGSARLTRSGMSLLKRVAGTIQSQFPGRTIRLVGHTDSDPIKKSGFKDNWSLGFERARAVAAYFKSDAGMPAENLVLASRGEYHPVASNKADAGKKKNRRVEVVVVLPRADLASYR